MLFNRLLRVLIKNLIQLNYGRFLIFDTNESEHLIVEMNIFNVHTCAYIYIILSYSPVSRFLVIIPAVLSASIFNHFIVQLELSNFNQTKRHVR